MLKRNQFCIRPFIMSMILLVWAMSGYAQVTLTASSGTASGSFTTLNAAFSAINAGTHQGVIVININANTTETSSAVLNASGNGSASYTSISIYPTAAGLSITGNITAPLIDLNGADNVTIDGRVNATGSTKSLSIVNSSASNTAATSTIRFIGDATSNTVRYCTLKGSSTNSSAGIVFFSTTTLSTGNDNNIITNNDITTAADANRPVNAIYAQGISGKNNENNTISNNNIFDFFNPGITSHAINIGSYNSGYTISGNSFYETTSFSPSAASVSYRAIYINAGTGGGNGFTVSGNYIGGSAASCGGTALTKNNNYSNNFTAIAVFTATGTASSVQGNTIQNISWTNPSELATADFVGIQIGGSANAVVGTVTGNTIGAATGTESIVFTGGSTGPSASVILGIAFPTTGTVDCQNNIIGAIRAHNSNGSIPTNFFGINEPTAGTNTIIGNTIGSTTTAGSITASSTALTGVAQNVIGIRCIGAATMNISGNTIANMVNSSENATGTTAGNTSGIYITAGTCTISNNTIRNLSNASANTTTGANASVTGISMSGLTNAAQTVSGNIVYNLSNSYSSFAGEVIGISYTGPLTASTVSRNFIHSLSVTGASSTAAKLYGMRIDAGATTYSNNIVSLGGNSKTDIYGIYENGVASNNNSLYFNTVYLSGSLASGATNVSYALYSAASTNTRDFRNNVLVNARSTTSGASKHYALYAATGGTITCDYNNYYVSGTGGVPGYYGADVSALPIVTGQDANSITTNPTFVSTGTNASDYTPSVFGTGVSISGITEDYGGNIRGASVTMGAWMSCANPTSGGTIAAAQTGASGFDPAAFTSSAAASGETGTLEYKWQSSTTSSSAGFSDIASSNSATYDAGALTQTTWYKRLARVTCKPNWTGAAESNVLEVAITKNWIGTTGNWSTAANWSDGVAPVSGDRLTVSSGTVTLDADFTVAGTLTLSGTGGLTIAPGVRLTVSGTADFGGRPVTFKSTASGTASLGAVTGTLSNATNVRVERYLPSGRKWRLLTAPLMGSSSNSVFANWQNNDAVSAGTGVEIWGPGGDADPGSGNSGLAIGPNPSMRSYGASGWQGVTNTNSTLLFDNTTNYGFSLFAAGPYNNGASVISPSEPGVATTISATGTLITGDHTKSMTAASAGQFFLVGNPYASSVDPRSFTTSAPVNRTNLNGKLWMWDAKPGAGIGNGLGRYVSFDLNINQYSLLGSGFTDHNVMIQSGQAFFVQATAPGAATLVFREASKNPTSTNSMMGDAIDQKAVLRFTLQEQTGTGTENLDGAVAVFHAAGRSGLDPLDGQKLMNTSENLALRRENRNLSFEHRPEVSGMDTLRLRIGNMREQDYVLEASGQGFTQTDMKAELVDRLTGVRQALDPGGITRYRFTVSSDSMSTGDRFMVVFGSRINGSGVTTEEVSGSPELRLFPNPATNRLSVRYSVASGGSLSLKVYDARGALVMDRWVEDRSGAGLLELNTSALPGGLYRVLLTDAAGSNQTQSFIRQ